VSFDSVERRRVTVGEWLKCVTHRGWEDESVWRVLREAALAAASSVRKTLQADDVDDVVSETILIARESHASWARDSVRDVELASWLGGVMKHQARAKRRAAGVSPGGDLQWVRAAASRPDAGESVDAGTDAPPRVSAIEALLTKKQRAACRLAARGLSQRVAAAELKISRRAYRDLLARARVHVASGVPALGLARRVEMPRRLLREAAQNGAPHCAEVARLRSDGWSIASCAELLGLSLTAVASRLKRIWKKIAMWKSCDESCQQELCRARFSHPSTLPSHVITRTGSASGSRRSKKVLCTARRTPRETASA